MHAFLIGLFLVLPWIHRNGQQLILLNVEKREFYLFGLHLRAHDTPLLLFLLLGFAFLIGLISTLWGRIWCGWACPQTVFIDSFYRQIEIWIEGNHRERKALDESPWDSNKLTKKALKYSLFLIASLLITHSFLAYFVGSERLLTMIRSSPTENWQSFLMIAFTTGIILFDFSWFREQFCVIVCPYGRFQSAMLDDQSTIVGYDAKRGEPRRNPATPAAPHGDCISCQRCVQVCPTGIDIRKGLQMECIGCTACIDACDAVMEKTKRPTGLIRYTSQAELAGLPKKRLRPRVFVYAALFLAAVSGLTFGLLKKEYLDVTVLRASEAPYQLINNGASSTVVNHFHLEISNQSGQRENLQFQISQNSPDIELVMPMNPLVVEENQNVRADFFLRSPKEKVLGFRKVGVEMKYGTTVKKLEVTFVGPNQ